MSGKETTESSTKVTKLYNNKTKMFYAPSNPNFFRNSASTTAPGVSGVSISTKIKCLTSGGDMPSRIFYGMLLALCWKGVVLLLWTMLRMYKSSYYRFGPSDDLVLPFVDVQIDTVGKYALVMLYIIVQNVVVVISGDLVYPWINAVAMNPSVPAPRDRAAAYMVVNFFWTLNSFNEILFFFLSVVQVDFALAASLTNVACGFLTSYWLIFDPKRAPPLSSSSSSSWSSDIEDTL